MEIDKYLNGANGLADRVFLVALILDEIAEKERDEKVSDELIYLAKRLRLIGYVSG